MTAGKAARLNRIGTAGRHLIVPMDHGLTLGTVEGLEDIEAITRAVFHDDASAADAVDRASLAVEV